ncbi:hypothetical protein FSP39_008796 [Pinctada imbricata]|uniref:MULE transposase domain-containing protein n=1 Tax=Pinctada imbricata TaxID=66713 RepID=A0AA88XX63_PINIB|nr:hypothetical protein FSP39_008796 [Pinctada imbricata]
MQDRLLIFATRQSLAHLTSAETIYAGGTFYACPSLFKQLYTIHAFVDGAMYPLVYALLPGKSEAIYRRMFGLLINACQRHNLTLSPNTIFLNFETAPRNAALHHFPGIIPKGCFSHFTVYLVQDTGIRLIDVIKLIQVANEVRLVQYAAGGKRAARKRKYKEIERRVEDQKTRLNNGEITAIAYADAASHLIHLG